MSTGHTRLEARFVGEPEQAEALKSRIGQVIAPADAVDAGTEDLPRRIAPGKDFSLNCALGRAP